MSQDLLVLVPRRTPLPDAKAWMAAARGAGIALVVGDFDPRAHRGGLTVTCDGLEASFEYTCDTTRDFVADCSGLGPIQWLRIRRHALVVGLTTHARSDDRHAAVLAGAALAVACRGIVHDMGTGTFVGHRNAAEWARRTAPPVDPELLRRRAAREAVARRFIATVLGELGYSAIDPPLESVGRGDLWFARSGSVFATELVEASVWSDDDETGLAVTFFASPFPLERLQREGRFGLSIGCALADYLSHVAHDEEQLLPRNITIEESLAEDATGERLRGELRRAAAGFSANMRSYYEGRRYPWEEGASEAE